MLHISGLDFLHVSYLTPLFMFEISICSSPKEHNGKPGLKGRDNRQVPTASCDCVQPRFNTHTHTNNHSHTRVGNNLIFEQPCCFILLILFCCHHSMTFFFSLKNLNKFKFLLHCLIYQGSRFCFHLIHLIVFILQKMLPTQHFKFSISSFYSLGNNIFKCES